MSQGLTPEAEQQLEQLVTAGVRVWRLIGDDPPVTIDAQRVRRVMVNSNAASTAAVLATATFSNEEQQAERLAAGDEILFNPPGDRRVVGVEIVKLEPEGFAFGEYELD